MIRIYKEDFSNYRPLDIERDFRYGMKNAVAFSLEKFDEYWESVTYYGEGFKDPTSSGIKANWVYVLVNPSMPGIAKIGYTTTSVRQRVDELNAQTASITPWYPVYQYKCPNGRMLEADVHEYFENRGVRVSHNREGFYVTTEQAKEVIEELGEKYQTL